MTAPLFVDSWGWIVLANRGEEAFEGVEALYRREVEAGHSILTSDYILDEVITFLFVKSPLKLAARYIERLLRAVSSGHIRLERVGADRWEAAWKMRLKFADHPKISFTDFTSFIVMKELGVFRVLTNDSHFEEVNLGFQRVLP